ncbi:MAG: hypothetical protein PWQ55_627 [Chloroflexota bacterium]|nr:hypothetical protein [Chloroflexota bacterium]
MRWLIVCAAAGVMFIIQAVQSFGRGETVSAVIFGGLAVIFLLLALAYATGRLRS